MFSGLVARKLGMTCVYDGSANVLPVTVLQVLNAKVVGTKTKAKEGYDAVVIGYGSPKSRHLKKTRSGVFAKHDLPPCRNLKEFRLSAGKVQSELCSLGGEVSLSNVGMFANQLIDVVGTSIGKGFSGVMKRHNFAGLEASHGVSVSHRSGGSTGGCQDPGRVFKNKKMAGQMGAKKVTIQNLRVVSFDTEKGIILVHGAVPGAKNSIVSVYDAVKQQSKQGGCRGN